MSRLRIFMIAGIIASLTATKSQAADLIYSMSGGTISGTLNGVAFTDATYSVTATADPANIQSHTVLGVVPSTYLLATTTMTIDGFDPVIFTDALFGVASANINAVSSGNSLIGFGTQLGSDSSTGFGPVGAGSPLLLSEPGSFSGDLITFTGLVSPGNATWATTGGTLVISSAGGIATLAITPVPEPSTILLGVSAAGLLAFTARRRTKRSQA